MQLMVNKMNSMWLAVLLAFLAMSFLGGMTLYYRWREIQEEKRESEE